MSVIFPMFYKVRNSRKCSFWVTKSSGVALTRLCYFLFRVISSITDGLFPRKRLALADISFSISLVQMIVCVFFESQPEYSFIYNFPLFTVFLSENIIYDRQKKIMTKQEIIKKEEQRTKGFEILAGGH